ncbi:hypothetical protein AB0B89_23710 [Sphaerisporangium sp. NPDC049002]|uniref:hypothetical protein n=1 Tax=Sphaerisporangium sp. NPDC049002 TaxID=3155392 RepID=UPI0033FCCCB3
MHDPLVVAFEIRRPWPRVSRPRTSDGRALAPQLYWPRLVTVWHREPGGRDSGEVCKHHTRHQDATGDWQWKFHWAWRLHVHHWKVQIPPLQELRRRILTRCAWCNGPHRKSDPVNVSHSWDGPRGRWWRGEPGLYHHDCSGIASAHNTCSCVDPVTEYEGSGRCARCTRYRPYGMTTDRMARVREMQAIPSGGRRAADGEQTPTPTPETEGGTRHG